jgi:DNA-binding beta-propeller fold protein YncE
MIKILVTTIFLLIQLSLTAQQIEMLGRIGNFENASAFFITPTGYIFVTDTERNEISKYDTSGTKIISIGGYGWHESSFDEPADIFATTLDVYVTDMNNHRIQIFDKDLNYLSSFSSKQYESTEYGFAFPISCATSNQGDLFILDSDNSRLLKFNLTGDFLTDIGGIDAGEFTLDNPHKLAISSDSKIYISDSDQIIVFDLFGTGLLKFQTPLKNPNINITFDHLSANDQNRVRIINLKNPSSILMELSVDDFLLDDEIVEVSLFYDKLFVLTNRQIVKYKLLK